MNHFMKVVALSALLSVTVVSRAGASPADGAAGAGAGGRSGSAGRDGSGSAGEQRPNREDERGKQAGASQTCVATGTALCVGCREAPAWIQAVVFTGISLFLIVFLQLLLNRLDGGTWSLRDALSEEVELTPQASAPVAGAGNTPAGSGQGAGGAAPLPLQTELRASSSRLIAFVGMAVITAFFVGLVYYVLWELFNCGSMSAQSDVTLVLYAGAALFAPYAVNKFSSLLKIKG